MDSTLRQPAPALRRRARLNAAQVRALRIVGWAVFGAIFLFPVLWVLFLAPTTGKFATTFASHEGSLGDPPADAATTYASPSRE